MSNHRETSKYYNSDESIHEGIIIIKPLFDDREQDANDKKHFIYNINNGATSYSEPLGDYAPTKTETFPILRLPIAEFPCWGIHQGFARQSYLGRIHLGQDYDGRPAISHRDKEEGKYFNVVKHNTETNKLEISEVPEFYDGVYVSVEDSGLYLPQEATFKNWSRLGQVLNDAFPLEKEQQNGVKCRPVVAVQVYTPTQQAFNIGEQTAGPNIPGRKAYRDIRINGKSSTILYLDARTVWMLTSPIKIN